MKQKSQPSLYSDGQWKPASGKTFRSKNPSTGETIWLGHAATKRDVAHATQAARKAFSSWITLPLQKRREHLESFASVLEKNKDTLADAIAQEVGKPHWESLTEVQAMVGKIAVSIDSYNTRCKEFQGGSATTRFKPHGVIAVFGAFNFPGHVSNGHIVPALLAGNTIVYKPSEYTPLVAQKVIEFWNAANLPKGVINLVQGAQPTGKALVNDPEIDGIFFTGSARTGIAISKALADQPQKIIALEMGGNNPLIVHKVSNLKAAALATIQSAYLTAGQRCTCARRLIVPEGKEGDQFLQTLAQQIPNIHVAPPTETPEPFMGPVISEKAAQSLLETQKQWLTDGATALIKLRHIKPNTGLVTPGLIDVTSLKDRPDNEVFGPLLQCIRTPNFNTAIEEANNTQYGLSAGLLCDDSNAFQEFYHNIHAGIVNWNQQLTGASGSVPFGGIGLSGNHRPTAYFAADYCAYPVASIENSTLQLPATLPPGITFS